MRRIRLLVLLVTLLFTAGCGNGETVNSAQTATSSTLPATTVFTVPPPPPEPAPPIPLPVLPGTENIVNVHSPVLPFRPGQTEWTATSSGVTVAVRMDTPAPKVGQPVTFDIAVATATLACCSVTLRPGGSDASFGGGGGCLPADRAGSRSATFRWVHVYDRSGRFELKITAIAGVCGGPLAGGGLSATIEVT
jgi:hypothetical protein